MTQSLADFLAQRNVDGETVELAAWDLVIALTGGQAPEELKQALVAHTAKPDVVEAELQRLEQDPLTRANAALALLSASWEDPAKTELTRAALTEARSAGVPIKTAILAIVAMYAMFLVQTGGVQHATSRVELKPDGSFMQETETTYYAPEGPLSTIVDLVKGGVDTITGGSDKAKDRPGPTPAK